MAWTLCTSGQATAKAGANCSTDIKSDATSLDLYSDMAEGAFCMKTRRNWISNPCTAALSGVIADAVSDLIAVKMINYDTSGYLKNEANLMLTVITNNFDNIIKDLREKQYQEKL